MGKKATSFLLYGLSIVFTLILAIITVIATNLDITKGGATLFDFAGLLLPGVILLNVALFFYWLIRRRWIICLIPLAAVIGCYSYYGAFYQNRSSIDKSSLMQKERTSNLRVLTYNTGNFLNKDNIRCARTLSDFMNSYQIDIACFQEYSMQGRYKDTVRHVLKTYPYSVSNATLDSIRLAIYSKYPILESRYVTYPNSNYGYIVSTIALSSAADSCENAIHSAPKVTLINTHLQSTGITTTKIEASRLAQAGAEMDNTVAIERMTARMAISYKMRAQQIDMLIQIIQNSPYPVILCGDFNDTPHSYVYNQASSLLLDGFKSGGSGYMYTYKYFKKILRIDYIFNSKELNSVRYFSPEEEWSDHNPVISELQINSSF